MTTWNVSKHIATSLREHDFYPFRWERKAFEHWYIPAFGPYLVAKLLAIPLYTSGESFSFLDIDEDIIFLSSVLTVSIMALLYLAWQKRIPFVFLKLKNHLIKAQQGNP